MYLWCGRCYHATPAASWSVIHSKYGVCPKCGCSEYRNAVQWEVIAEANGYPETPDKTVVYNLLPRLF